MRPNDLRALADAIEQLTLLREGGLDVTYTSGDFTFGDRPIEVRFVDGAYVVTEIR